MPLEFPEEALEAIANEMDLTAKDWFGDGTKRARVAVSLKWREKATLIRLAIDAHRSATNAAPLSRRQRLTDLIDDTAAGMQKAASRG